LINRENYKLSPGFTATDAQWFNVHEVPKLPYDHSEIFDAGFKFLKHKVRHEPIGFNLLPKKFTLHQIQKLYEAILDKELDKPNFRRKLLNMELLVPCHEKQKDVSHRAASLYRFDKKVYDLLIDKGFAFEL
jgi:8-oxo-dGTP diphosphatase